MTPFDIEHPEVEILREQVEFLREQIDSLHQLVERLDLDLLNKQQQIQALEQELAQTNKELCHALTPHQQEITKVKQLAQQIGQRQQSISESLAALLNAIYGCAILAKELEVEETILKTAPLPNMVAQQILDNSKELRIHSQQLSSQSKELGFQFIGNKDSFMKYQEEVAQNSTESPQQSENETVLPQRLKEYKISIEANVTQLQKHLEQTKKLVDKSKIYVKLVKSRPASLSNSKKMRKAIYAKHILPFNPTC